MKIKTIGKKLNGQHLNSLLGDVQQRNEFKKYLLNTIVDEKAEEEKKKQCHEELDHIRKLEKDTAEKQEKHSAFRFGILVIWTIIILIYIFVTYLIITHMNGQLDLDKDTTKIFVGLITSLIVFQMAVGTGSILRGASIKVKEPRSGS